MGSDYSFIYCYGYKLKDYIMEKNREFLFYDLKIT